jgi:ribonuclease M5
MSKNTVIVVEGIHDEQKIKSIYPEINCIVTNGSEISNETLNLIYKTSLKSDVILFLDPDFPGKRIMNRIIETKGNYKLAYINKSKAISKNKTKVGIEHANTEDIKSALANLIDLKKQEEMIKNKDLQTRKLINSENSANLRKLVCNKLEIPYSNGKSFLKFLNMIGIDIERLDRIIDEIKP